MGMRTELDVNTGKMRQINTTAYTVNGVLVFVDEGQPVPRGAVMASTIPLPEVVSAPPQITQTQADKLIAFLKANPDIVAAAKL